MCQRPDLFIILKDLFTVFYSFNLTHTHNLALRLNQQLGFEFLMHFVCVLLKIITACWVFCLY